MHIGFCATVNGHFVQHSDRHTDIGPNIVRSYSIRFEVYTFIHNDKLKNSIILLILLNKNNIFIKN